MTAIAFTSTQCKTLMDGSLRITVTVEPRDASNAFGLFGMPGVAGAMVRLTDEAAKTALQDQTIAADRAPYATQAAILWKSTFFRTEIVWKAIGTDEHFLAWVRMQPCAKSGLCTAGDRQVVAAHVRRIENGAGMGLKPPYSAIPLLQETHALQHQHGESVIAPREWWDKQRILHVQNWAWQTLKAQLGYEHWNQVPPSALREWATESNVDQFVPYNYREDAI